MRLISWNVNGRVRVIEEQIAVLKRQRCDIVALQETTKTTIPVFREGLQGIGLLYVTDSFQSVADKTKLVGPRRFGEIIACRWPLRVFPANRFNVPWPERILSVVINSPCGNMHFYTTHIPPGVSNGWKKIAMLEGIFKGLAHKSRVPRILCGDFNTPREETSDGRVITWDREGSRWDQGERNVLVGLSEFDLTDVFRYRHGYKVQEYSWYSRPHIGRRVDHVFASHSLLNNVKCRYIHSFREEHLSDHSALRVDFAIGHSVRNTPRAIS
jgi:exonuclease III